MAIEQSELINDMRGKANSFDGLGNIHWHKGRYDKSLENLYISLDILKELNDQAEFQDLYFKLDIILIKVNGIKHINIILVQ